MHGAGAALTVIAALLGAGKAQSFTQHVEQGRPRVDFKGDARAIDAGRDRDRRAALLSRSRRDSGFLGPRFRGERGDACNCAGLQGLTACYVERPKRVSTDQATAPFMEVSKAMKPRMMGYSMPRSIQG